MDYDLPDDMKTLREMARKFAGEVIAPQARKWDRESAIPPEAIKQIAELGFLGVLIPEHYDGAGLGYLGMAIVMEEVARHCGEVLRQIWEDA